MEANKKRKMIIICLERECHDEDEWGIFKATATWKNSWVTSTLHSLGSVMSSFLQGILLSISSTWETTQVWVNTTWNGNHPSGQCTHNYIILYIFNHYMSFEVYQQGSRLESMGHSMYKKWYFTYLYGHMTISSSFTWLGNVWFASS